jgi:hypothetical protein
VSWLCRDTRRQADHKAEIIFSNRAGMKYSELRDYMATLMKQHENGTHDVRIDWSVIDCNLIRSETHKSMKGLQVADIVASSTFSALHHNRYDLTELGYLQRIRGIIYKNKGMIAGYGIKIWPNDAVKNGDAVAAIQALAPRQ